VREDVRKALSVLFDPGEEVVAQTSQAATFSVPQSEIDEERTMLIAVNPIKGWRVNANVTTFRSFLVELDSMPILDQHAYVQRMGMPYSLCVFSGNKSLHFAISLDRPIPDLKSFQFVGAWIANIMAEADQQPPRVPSRGLRFPGHLRRDTGKEQTLVEVRGRVRREDLNLWLSRHQDKRPIVSPPKKRNRKPDWGNLSPWVHRELQGGIDESKGRNNRWYSIAMDFFLAGYELEDAIEILDSFFHPEFDFTRHEWESTLRHAYKKGASEQGT
jgi:hypothetical protein